MHPTSVSNVDLLESSLESLPSPTPRSILILVCGLPGAGKSYFSRKLMQKVPLAYIQSDVMRKTLFPTPNYSDQESFRLFQALHLLIKRFLQRRIPVLFDATSLTKQHRAPLYRIADELGVKLFIVFTTAPQSVVKGRLDSREKGSLEAGRSDADWDVYLKMLPRVQLPRREHLVVDTSRDIMPAIESLAQEIRAAMALP